MSRVHSTTTAVLTAILLALSIGLIVQYASVKPDLARVATATAAETATGTSAAATPPAANASAKSTLWAASAPGRIEPRGGEIRIGALVSGRIAEVIVQMNDRVVAGDLLVRIDDDEAQAKLAAAESEAGVRKRERDAETVGRLAQDRRAAEDAVAAADRSLYQARRDLDRALVGRRAGTAADDEVARTRAAVAAAREKTDQERLGLRRTQATSGMPLPTRLESSLATARAELLQIETAIERSRLRAAADGTILQVAARLGETAVPSPEQPLIIMGDLSGLRVRAEVEERDVNKVRLGQKAVLRSDAYPGRDFAGTVTTIGQSLAPPRLPSRGPRRPTDVDALEVLIDVEAAASLLPGMRTDVFFVPDTTVQAAPTPPVKAN